MNLHFTALRCGLLIFTGVVISASSVSGQAQSSGTASDSSVVGKPVRHDPFGSPLAQREPQVGASIGKPHGTFGLVVRSLRVDGIVKSDRGFIAVMAGPEGRTYFLREGEQLYDGRVEKISVDGVSFVEVVRDAFGKSSERQVNKRIYSSAGEQQ